MTDVRVVSSKVSQKCSVYSMTWGFGELQKDFDGAYELEAEMQAEFLCIL